MDCGGIKRNMKDYLSGRQGIIILNGSNGGSDRTKCVNKCLQKAV